MTEEWTDPDRRRTGPVTLAELEQHIDQRIQTRLAELSARDKITMDARFDEIKLLLISAFPGGDPAAHRLAHEEMIAWVRARRRFLENLAEKLATGGIFALVGFVLVALWQYFKIELLK